MKWKKLKWILLIALAVLTYPIPGVPTTILIILCGRELYKMKEDKLNMVKD